MNSVEVIGFGITTAASDAEKEAAYKFIAVSYTHLEGQKMYGMR